MDDIKDLKKKEDAIEKQREELKEDMKKRGIEAVIRKEVKKFGSSAHIILPSSYIGKKAVILVIDEKKFGVESSPQNGKK